MTNELRKREFRYIPARELRIKRNADGKPQMGGYAAVFNSLSQDLGGFKERIAPGAFTTSLKNSPDVRALFNHDENIVLGRTKSGTLRLSEDETGLAFEADLPDTAMARDLAVSIERGDVDQCSFGFYCMADDWTMIDSTPVRSVTTAELFDVSAVTYPAYTQTSVTMRSLWRDGQPESIQRSIAALRAQDDPHKTVDGEVLRADDFLIVGDPKDPETWKLPWHFSTEEKTKSHLRDALARFDQLEDVSEAEKKAAWTKLVQLCGKHDIDVAAGDTRRARLRLSMAT